ncbi:MAG: hypothetical protein ACOZJX_11845 [Pseudomonadota bacterium]
MSPIAPRFSSRENAVRRIAAGLAMAVTLGIAMGVAGLADYEYDRMLIAQADKAPVQVAVVSAPRLPQG